VLVLVQPTEDVRYPVGIAAAATSREEAEPIGAATRGVPGADREGCAARRRSGTWSPRAAAHALLILATLAGEPLDQFPQGQFAVFIPVRLVRVAAPRDRLPLRALQNAVVVRVVA